MNTPTQDNGGLVAPEMRPNEYGGLTPYNGMTLRDYFAGQALAGAMANPVSSALWGAKQMTLACYDQADAMIEARVVGEPPEKLKP